MRGALFVSVLLAGVTASQVTPIGKVTAMLEDMLAKGKEEKNAEEVRYSAYNTFCADTSADRTNSINAAKQKLEQLAADIQAADADAMVAGEDIAKLDSDITGWEADKKEASEVRAEAKADYDAQHADYVSSISAVERALNVLKAGPAGQVGTSLLEVSALPRLPEKAKKVIVSFLQQDGPVSALMQDAAEYDAPEAAAFESSSGGVINMVTELGEKFQDEKNELEKQESEGRHSYDMMSQQLTDQIEQAVQDRTSKKAHKNKRLSDKAGAEGEQSDTSKGLAEDEKFLSDLTSECEQKATDFAKRQELRQGELDAINKAIEIMSSDAVAGSGAKHLPSLVQQSTSLAQLRSNTLSPVQQAVASFLADKARKTNSRVLSFISTKVQEDPFKKVTKMIKDMIVHLTEEATADAEHEGFCDTELATNKQTRESKTDTAASLKAEIEKLNADIAKLAMEISELGAAIASIDEAVTKATELRTAEKEKNQETIADAKAGQAAVSQATQVLKEFYDKAAGATALTQMKVPGSPETFDESYKGMASGGVMGLLEVCLSDFARLEADTSSGEDEAQSIYHEFSSDSAEDKAVKSAQMKHDEELKTKRESALATAKTDLKSTQEELDAAMAYYEKLKPSCVDAAESYEERTARRREEIEDLNEALKILSGDSV